MTSEVRENNVTMNVNTYSGHLIECCCV